MFARTGQQRTKVQKDRKKLDKVEYVLGSKEKTPPPLPGPGEHFDGCVAILSRMYDPDRDRVLGRARPDGVSSMLCWTPEIDKLEELCKLCKGSEALCYFMAGVHPDNISRTNKAQQEAWHLKVDEFSRERNCLAIFSGLNLTRRDVGSHFAQEAMLRCLYQQARTLSVPLVLFIEGRAAEGGLASPLASESDSGVNVNAVRALAVLRDEGWGPDELPVVVMNAVGACGGQAETMEFLASNGLHASVCLNDLLMPSSPAEEEAEVSPALLACLRAIPRDRLLLSSNSPHHTPQNINDESIRRAKNEPSNFGHMIRYLAPLLQLTDEELASLNFSNSKRVFQIDGSRTLPVGDADQSTGEAAKEPEVAAECAAGGIAQQQPALPADAPSAADDSARYTCSKCGAGLFAASQLAQRHGMPGADGQPSPPLPSVFRAGSDVIDYCTAVYVLSSDLLSAGALADDDRGNVCCGACAAKIGKRQEVVAGSDAALKPVTCPCGFALDASAGFLRLASSKVQLSAGARAPSAPRVSAPMAGKASSSGKKKGDVSNSKFEEPEDSSRNGGKKGKGGKKKV